VATARPDARTARVAKELIFGEQTTAAKTEVADGVDSELTGVPAFSETNRSSTAVRGATSAH
jgi:hypothetical protein